MPELERRNFANKSSGALGPYLTAEWLNMLQDVLQEAHDHLAVAGSNVHDETPQSIGAAPTLHGHDAATEHSPGFMPSAAVTKLAGVEDGATADQDGAEIAALLDAEPNRNPYTDDEKTKLAGLESSKFLGTFVSLSALETAHPGPVEGSYAYVDAGAGANPQQYIWDSSDTAYVQGAGGTADTASQVKTKYESNPDTNAYTDVEKAKLGGVEQGAAADMTAAEILASLNAGDPGSFDPDLLGNAPGAPKTKLAYLTFGGGSAGIGPRTNLSDWHVRNVIRLPVKTTRYRFRIRNIQLTNELVFATAVNIIGGYMGKHKQDGNGDWTGDFIVAPQQMFGVGEMPQGGGEYISGWVTDPAKQFEAQEEYVVSVGYTAPAGTSIAQASNKAYVGSTSGAANNIANPINALGLQPFTMMIEYEFTADRPVGIVIGDSITEGTGSRRGQRHNWGNQYALSSGSPVIVSGCGGSQAQDWINPGYKYNRFKSQNPNWDLGYAVIAPGRNDLSAGRTAAQIQSNLTTIMNLVRSELEPERLYLATILPTLTAGWSVSQEIHRQNVNSWMRSLPNNAISVLDFDMAVRDDHKFFSVLPGTFRGEWSGATGYVDGDIVFFAFAYFRANGSGTGFSPLTVPGKWSRVYGIHADYGGDDQGDGIHPNEAGQARMMSVVPPMGS